MLKNHSLFTSFTCDFVDTDGIYHKLSSYVFARLKITYLLSHSLHGSCSVLFIKLVVLPCFLVVLSFQRRSSHTCAVFKMLKNLSLTWWHDVLLFFSFLKVSKIVFACLTSAEH